MTPAIDTSALVSFRGTRSVPCGPPSPSTVRYGARLRSLSARSPCCPNDAYDTLPFRPPICVSTLLGLNGAATAPDGEDGEAGEAAGALPAHPATETEATRDRKLCRARAMIVTLLGR